MISATWKLQTESTIEHGALQKLHIFNIMAEVKTIIKSRPDYCSTLNDLIIVELQMSRTKYIIPQLVCVQSWVFWEKHVKECILKLKNSTLTLKFRADQSLDFLWVGGKTVLQILSTYYWLDLYKCVWSPLEGWSPVWGTRQSSVVASARLL